MINGLPPNEWENFRLLDITKLQGGKTPSKADPSFWDKGTICWVSPKDMKSHVLLDTQDKVTDRAVQDGGLKLFPPDSILFVVRSGILKHSFPVAISSRELTVNQDIKVIEPSSALEARYTAYILRAFGKQILGSCSKAGTTVNSVEIPLLEKLALPLAPLAEQKIIADKLDTLLAQVENTKARLERIPHILKCFRQSVLAAAFSGRLTEEWRSENEYVLGIEKYLDLVKGFKIKAKGLVEPVQEGNWLSCQLGHILSVKSGDGLISKRMIPEGGIPVYGGNGINGYHDQANTSKPTIVIGRVGFYCGSVHLTEAKSWVTDNALIVSFPENLLNTDFVYWLLMATNLREDTASSAQPVISGSKIYGIKISLPPVEEQTEIVRRVNQLLSHADRVDQQVNNALARVNNLTQSILAKAFRGELTEQWRKDNPELISGENSAGALLERIKAERAAQKPAGRRTKISKTEQAAK